MTILTGPVLYFRGAEARSWRLSALVVTATGDEPLPLRAAAQCVPPYRVVECDRRDVWRYDFSLSLGKEAGCREYHIGGQSWLVHLPAAPGTLRLAYTACNGSEQDNVWRTPQERNAHWLHLAAQHARHPFHLLLQGGDQLYADSLWREVPALAEWRRMPWRKRRHIPFSLDLAQVTGRYYFDQYCRLWSQAQLAPLLATIPSLMMWDDHDIIDGWGSYPAAWQECAVFQGVWSAARNSFALFQLAARPDDLPEGFSDRRGGHFGWAYRLGEVGILAPDLRSERTRRQVMGPAGWRALTQELASLAPCRHILLLSSVPLVNAHLGALERLFNVIPGHQSWQDDLIDQWPSLAHWQEWTRLLRTLISFAERGGPRITSVSGEVHLGSLGLIESGATRIYQFTSSGIVHPPPPAPLVSVLEQVGVRPLHVAPDLTAKLLPLPGVGRRFLRARNWLELELAVSGHLVATWHGEGLDATARLSIPAVVATGRDSDGT